MNTAVAATSQAVAVADRGIRPITSGDCCNTDPMAFSTPESKRADTDRRGACQPPPGRVGIVSVSRLPRDRCRLSPGMTIPHRTSSQ